jgi:ferredoxin
MPKIIHYRNKCIGCGICYELQPEVWRMSKKDGKATLINATVKKDIFILPVMESMHHQSQDVAKACPVKIIKIV